MEGVGRFNEAIDQAIAESVDFFSAGVDWWRNLFLGVLGHDLRGPLNAILLTSRLIGKLSDGTPVGYQTARLIRSGERMKELLDDLVDYNRASLHVGLPITPKPIDLATVCQEENELQRTALPACRIEFSSQGSTQGCWDASRVRQVIGNLIMNLAKCREQEGTVALRLCGDDALVRLSGENRGAASSESLQVLFEPLRRAGQGDADSERTSLGRGLFIVRETARAMAERFPQIQRTAELSSQWCLQGRRERGEL